MKIQFTRSAAKIVVGLLLLCPFSIGQLSGQASGLQINAVFPAELPPDYSSGVVIAGQGFIGVTGVTVDGVPVKSFVASSTRRITATLANPTLRPVLVTVKTQGGEVGFAPNPRDPGPILNLSTRAKVGTGAEVLIAGFFNGFTDKRLLLRSLGPSLSVNGAPVAGRLSNPLLELHSSFPPDGSRNCSNDDWKVTRVGGLITSEQSQQIKDSGLAPPDDLESAMIVTAPNGDYTAIVKAANGATGIALLELYDLDPQPTVSPFLNVSSRGFAGTGDNVMIAGLTMGGPNPTKVVLRGIGPFLSTPQAGSVPGTLPDPVLELYDSAGELLASNDDWGDWQRKALQFSGIPPQDSRESAMVVTLSPGSYTVVVHGKLGATGVALAEVYRQDPQIQ